MDLGTATQICKQGLASLLSISLPGLIAPERTEITEFLDFQGRGFGAGNYYIKAYIYIFQKVYHELFGEFPLEDSDPTL